MVPPSWVYVYHLETSGLVVGVLYHDFKTLNSLLAFASDLLAVWHWAGHGVITVQFPVCSMR